MSEFNGRVCWVTGAAGALGRSIAMLLAEKGATVVVSGRTESTLPEAGKNLYRSVLDVTDREAVDRTAQAIISTHGRIDCLVTCTTIARFGDFLLLQDDDWTAVFNAKLMGSIRLVRAVLPAMIEQGQGSIVLISGRGGTVPPPRHLPGSSVNAAINLLVQGLATQYGQHGIRVNSVAPGPVESPRLNVMQQGVASTTSALGGPGTPADVAQAVTYLLSAQAKHITGITLPVDGGRAPS